MNICSTNTYLDEYVVITFPTYYVFFRLSLCIFFLLLHASDLLQAMHPQLFVSE